jgi:hypothetical protein
MASKDIEDLIMQNINTGEDMVALIQHLKKPLEVKAYE